jgi:hypothetical protein
VFNNFAENAQVGVDDITFKVAPDGTAQTFTSLYKYRETCKLLPENEK